MTASSGTPALQRALVVPRPPGWLIGWWFVGRAVVFTSLLFTHASVANLDSRDAGWYLSIAKFGYLLIPGRPSNPAFFPLYPVVLRAVHELGVRWAVAGPLVSNIAFLPGLLLFHRLTRELFDETLARRATTFLAIFPLSYVFSMGYPESLVLALGSGGVLAAMRGRWWLAAACVGAAALARPEAVFLALPLAGLAWQQRETLGSWSRGAALGAIVAPGAALAAFLLYLATVLHDPRAWSEAQTQWGRHVHITGRLDALAGLPHSVWNSPAGVRDTCLLVVYLGLLLAAWRLGTPRLWLAAAVGVVIFPLTTGTVHSIGRFGLLAPPLFWGLAWSMRTARQERILQAASLVLLVLGTLTVTNVNP
jgi:hypothetical protein